MKFRQRPVFADAARHDGKTLLPGMVKKAVMDSNNYQRMQHGFPTPEGFLVVLPGDWVVTHGPDLRTIYSAKAFEAAFEEVDPILANPAPNPRDSWSQHRARLKLELDLTGVSYEWQLKDSQGKVSEVWCIPTFWISEYLDGEGNLMEYQVRSPVEGTRDAACMFGTSVRSGNVVRIPADQIKVERKEVPREPA